MLAYEQDVGTSLLFFGVFAAMLYMATRRGAYLVGTLVLLAIGSVFAYHVFGHVQVRVDTWLNPWKTRQGTGYQIIQAQYAFGSGGIAGTGLGLGSPNLIPNAATDFVFAAIGEELGLVGTIGVVAAFMLLVGSAFRIAADATRPFAQALRGGHRDDPRLPDVPDRRRRHARDPAHRHHAAVRVLRRVVARRQLRAARDPAAHLRRHARERAAPSAMNIGIRRVGIAIMVLFLGLVAQLTYLQVADSSKLADDPHNTRKFLARPPPAARRDRHLRRRRASPSRCPTNDDVPVPARVPAGHRQAVRAGRRLPVDPVRIVGVEAQVLVGARRPRPRPRRAQNLRQLVADQPVTGTVVLTLSAKAQTAAAAALDGRRGSVVVLDVNTGGVVAMYSNPTFDPDAARVAQREDRADRAASSCIAAPDQPLLARAWRELYPPGSTFKTVTAATALDDGVDVNKKFPQLKELPLPLTTNTLENFGGERCGGTLEDGFIAVVQHDLRSGRPRPRATGSRSARSASA